MLLIYCRLAFPCDSLYVQQKQSGKAAATIVIPRACSQESNLMPAGAPTFPFRKYAKNGSKFPYRDMTKVVVCFLLTHQNSLAQSCRPTHIGLIRAALPALYLRPRSALHLNLMWFEPSETAIDSPAASVFKLFFVPYYRKTAFAYNLRCISKASHSFDCHLLHSHRVLRRHTSLILYHVVCGLYLHSYEAHHYEQYSQSVEGIR